MDDEFRIYINLMRRRLISLYMMLLTLEIFLHAGIYYFIIGNMIFALCLLFFFFIVFYTYLLMRKIKIETVIHSLFIYSLLLIIFISLNLKRDSIVCLFWLMPVPLGAYVLLGNKATVFYICLVFVVAVFDIIICEFVSIEIFDVHYPKNIVWLTDRFAWLCNLITFCFLIYFSNKMHEFEKNCFKKKAEILQKTSQVPHKDNTVYENLFKEIQDMVESNFKDPNLSVGKIADKLGSNRMYIAHAIKTGEFDNFTNFVNSVRIRHVKKQIEEGALKTTTLSYICREAGFINYTTFNRAFKKVEKITPSDYIKKLNLSHSA